ncbi:MAG: molybdopterin converting factor subunit 1 [Janthinobacterium lividum]
MQIELKYFASLRETVGLAHESVTLPAAVGTLAQLRQWLRQRGPTWQAALGDARPLRMALDQQMAGPEARLSEGCEVAFFPPVTGG